MAQIAHHEELSRDSVKPPSERSFGFTFAAVFSLFGLWLFWRRGQSLWSAALLAAALGFLIAAIASPQVLRPINLLWLKFGLVLHRIVNPIVMGLLFFVVFLPTGIIMRLLGRDLLRLKRNPNGVSYWIVRSPEADRLSNMKNQF